MKALVLGDIHGNIIALEKVVRYFKHEVDQIISHGDVVNYGPWSNECVELLKAEKSVCLKGNHEEAYLKGFYPGSNSLVKDFFNQTFPKFKYFDEIKKYGGSLILDGFDIKHTIDNKYYYPDTDISDLDLKNNTIIGHSHYPFLRRLKNGKMFINTGSVGQNRIDLSLIDFVIVDFEHATAMLKRITYDPRPIINEMIRKHYPRNCIEYYQSKLRKK